MQHMEGPDEAQERWADALAGSTLFQPLRITNALAARRNVRAHGSRGLLAAAKVLRNVEGGVCMAPHPVPTLTALPPKPWLWSMPCCAANHAGQVPVLLRDESTRARRRQQGQVGERVLVMPPPVAWFVTVMTPAHHRWHGASLHCRSPLPPLTLTEAS